MSGEECGEHQAGRRREHWQRCPNSHRHDDRLAAFFNVDDCRTVISPNRGYQRFVEVVAQLALEQNGVMERLVGL